MSPEFKAGVRRAFMRNAPVFAGAGTGALTGIALSPSDDRTKYMGHGAVIGAGVGVLRLKKWRKGLSARWQPVSP